MENVLIEGIAAEGNAVAHIDGKALFVPQCVPGDVVNVFVCKDNSYCARILQSGQLCTESRQKH